MTYKNLQVCCVECHKETKTSGLANHYNRIHGNDDELKRRALFSNLMSAERARIKATERTLEECKKYSSNPNFCQVCDSEIDFFRRKNKYCSASCAVTNTNKSRGPRSEDTKRKISESNMGKPKDKMVSKSYCSVFFHKCTQCESIIISKGKSAKRKTCSRECQIHASVGVRSYTNGRRLNIYHTKTDGTVVLLESSWEEKLAKHLDYLDIKWVRPKPINYVLDNKTRLYYPDFFLPETGLYLDPKNPTALKLSLDKMDIVSNLIPLWYGDIDRIIDAIPSVRVAGFEPATQYLAPAPKAGGMNQTIRHSD